MFNRKFFSSGSSSFNDFDNVFFSFFSAGSFTVLFFCDLVLPVFLRIPAPVPFLFYFFSSSSAIS